MEATSTSDRASASERQRGVSADSLFIPRIENFDLTREAVHADAFGVGALAPEWWWLFLYVSLRRYLQLDRRNAVLPRVEQEQRRRHPRAQNLQPRQQNRRHHQHQRPRGIHQY